MELNVIKNAKRNMLFGIMNRVVTVLCPFIKRTVIQYVLGEQYLGLTSLFTSVLSVLSLTELGFGMAVTYSMYKPVAEGDTETVNALLNFYRKVYAVIGSIILVLGLALIPILPELIEGKYPKDVSLTALYLVYLANAVISYFMFAYKSALLVVYQRDDINSRTNIILTLLFVVSQVFILIKFRSYLLFSLTLPIFTLLNNVRIAVIVDRMFPQYHCSGHIPAGVLGEMKKQVAGSFVTKVCQVSRNSFVSVCISAFLGLAMTAMYNNYYYILLAVSGFTDVFSAALMGGVGNHVATRSREDNFKELRELDFAYMWINGWCMICILCMSQPFMRLWMGENMLLSDSVVFLVCIYFYLLKIGDMRFIYFSSKGLWWQRRWNSLAEALANICLNVLLAKYFGIHGIILATILSLFFIGTLWGAEIVFRHYFGIRYLWKYFRYHVGYAAVTAALAMLTYLVCEWLPKCGGITELFLRGGVCLVLPNFFYVLFYHRLPYYKRMKRAILGE